MEINEIKTLLLKTLTFSPNQGIEGIDDAAKAILLQIQASPQPEQQLTAEHMGGTKFHFITHDEREAYRLIKSGAMASCLWDIRECIRSTRKYQIGEVPADRLLEKTLDEISDTIQSAVNLEEVNW